MRARFANAKDVTQMRQTMVFLLEDGVWRIVHVHNSNPAPNVEYFGYVHQAYDDLLGTVGQEDPNLAASGSATAMFTDIAGSTSLAEAVGDARWAALVLEHLKMIAAVVTEGGGQMVKTMGDGTMSAFASAGQAMSAASEIQKQGDAFRNGAAY